jgi:anti-anti-sigma regulatory factor
MHALRATWAAGGHLPVVTLVGEIDFAEISTLDAIAVVAAQTEGVIVDLSRVSFVDLAGLSALERLLKAPNVAERDPSPAVVRIRSFLSVGREPLLTANEGSEPRH